MTDTAIAKRDSQGLTKQISHALEEFQNPKKYHLLGPRTQLGTIPGGTMLSIRELTVDPKDQAQIYRVGQGRVALAGTVLDKLGAAAGISTATSERVDDRKHPHYWEFSVRLRVTDLDGSIREEVGTKTLDLRADAGGGIPGKDWQSIADAAQRADPPRDPTHQISEARKFGSEICASKAKNRATAHLLGIARAYLPKDLAKPFIVPKLVPDGANPVSQQAILANMMGSANALYSAAGAAVGKAAADVIDADFEDASEPAPGAPASAATVPESDADDEPAHDPNGEVLGSAEVGTILDGAWFIAKRNEVDADTFRKICQTQTGCQSRDEMTATQAASVASAVKAYIANKGHGAPV